MTSVFGGVVVVAMMIYIVVNALSRTFFNYSLPASLEIVQYLLMPGLVSVGFVAATLADRHVTADMLYAWFPPAGRKWVVVGALVLSVLTLAVLVWFSWEHAVYALQRRFKAGYTDVPSWPLYFFVPITLGLSALLMAGKAVIGAMRPAECYAEPSEHDGSEPEAPIRREIA
ncbi:TRAP transporter small permease [Nonomuraea sp. NPDC005650]|uniref:TRAP transporter small permease n=1 Tax=Nonomuraea sp. NPDC005650 TaxID=3157045 RepID=UPI0033B6D613